MNSCIRWFTTQSSETILETYQCNIPDNTHIIISNSYPLIWTNIVTLQLQSYHLCIIIYKDIVFQHVVPFYHVQIIYSNHVDIMFKTRDLRPLLKTHLLQQSNGLSQGRRGEANTTSSRPSFGGPFRVPNGRHVKTTRGCRILQDLKVYIFIYIQLYNIV